MEQTLSPSEVLAREKQELPLNLEAYVWWNLPVALQSVLTDHLKQNIRSDGPRDSRICHCFCQVEIILSAAFCPSCCRHIPGPC